MKYFVAFGMSMAGLAALIWLLTFTPATPIFFIVFMSLTVITGMTAFTLISIMGTYGQPLLIWVFRPMMLAGPWGVFAAQASQGLVLVVAPVSLLVGQVLGLIIWFAFIEVRSGRHRRVA